jgi:predicted peptidase
MRIMSRVVIMMTLVLSLGAGSQTPATAPAASATGFLYRTLEFDGKIHAYSIYVPPDYDASKAWPIILFLHGSGERGEDGLLQTEVGIGSAIRRNWRQVPAIVVMPQCPPNQIWVGPMGQMALKCVEAVSREYNCDHDRFYLTGLSLGGHGVWHLAAQMPDRLAAIVPICGFAELEESTGAAERLAPKLVKLPIWCAHGDQDKAVPIAKAREMVEAVRKAGGHVIFKEHANMGHNVWDATYGDPALWRWLFAQKRGVAPTEAPTEPSAEKP